MSRRVVKFVPSSIVILGAQCELDPRVPRAAPRACTAAWVLSNRALAIGWVMLDIDARNATVQVTVAIRDGRVLPADAEEQLVTWARATASLLGLPLTVEFSDSK